MRILLSIVTALFLAGCAGKPNITDPNLSQRQLNLEDFFAGHSTAHGQFQDVFGTVKRRFRVDIQGDWDGKTLTLTEDFVYNDGETEQRVWVLEKTGAETWRGRAVGVVGTAYGREKGDAFNWVYTIDLKGPKSTTRVTFDDWMWLLDDNRLFNRAYVSKYGITIGEVLIYFER